MRHLWIIREGIKEILATYLHLKHNFSNNEVKFFEHFLNNAIEDAKEFFGIHIDVNDERSIKKAIEDLNKF